MSAPAPSSPGPRTVSLADEEGVKQILVGTILGLWDIVNNLTGLRPSKQERYRVTIFGSARARPGTFVWHYDNEPETRAALDLIFSDHFSPREPGIFAPLRETLLTGGDYYMHLADLSPYLEADRRLVELYADGEGWARKAVLNISASGKFSSDRTIADYAAEIWGAKPCPVS